MPSVTSPRPVFSPAGIRSFRTALLAWFDTHKRDLPWRRTRDPYAIWVSEIMLQQTRVAAVLDHYARWMARFPTIETLAAATEDEVLAGWSGLGYYRRARFLHRGAKTVTAEYGGKLPTEAAALCALPGIGTYTSAAIASIAFGRPAAVVDGNVERVLLRQAGAGEPASSPGGATTTSPGKPGLSARQIQTLASDLLDPRRPGDFNQALMELGATVCLPRNPLCLRCPVRKSCRTRGEHPIALRKPPLQADIHYAFIQRRRSTVPEVLLVQRPASSTVMPGMWEMPRLPADPSAAEPLLTLRHSIMQTNYRVTVTALPPGKARSGPAQWVGSDRLQDLPLTGLARKIFLRLEFLRKDASLRP